jgi:hypothetical protein
MRPAPRSPAAARGVSQSGRATRRSSKQPAAQALPGVAGQCLAPPRQRAPRGRRGQRGLAHQRLPEPPPRLADEQGGLHNDAGGCGAECLVRRGGGVRPEPRQPYRERHRRTAGRELRAKKHSARSVVSAARRKGASVATSSSSRGGGCSQGHMHNAHVRVR